MDDLTKFIPAVLEGANNAIQLYKTVTGSFKKRYDHHPAAVQRKAESNATDVAIRIKKKIDALVELDHLSADQVDQAMTSPDFALMLERAILNASETDSALKHEDLALLIADRLRHYAESGEALAIRRACQDVPNLSERQLRLLALIYAIENLEPTHQEHGTSQERLDAAVVGIAQILEPFENLEIKNVDLSHLAGLGLIDFAPHVGHGMWFGHEANQAKALQYLTITFGMLPPSNPEPLRRLTDIMQGNTNEGRPGLQAARPLPIGWVIGRCVYCGLVDEPFGFRWE